MDYVIKLYKDWRLHSEFTAIVTEMDDDYMFNEKQSIRESARSLKKYGSTCNHVRNDEVLIRHEIEKTDTLQGIALKYGCTTEQIRRVNRLFASDSLFLRQFLMIPVTKGSPFYPKDDRPQSMPPRAFSIAGMQQTGTQNVRENNNSKSMDSVVISPEEENRKSIDEFLGKIDSTIEKSKEYVAKSQSGGDFITSQSDDDIFTTGGVQKRRVHSSSSSNSSHHHVRHSSSGSATDTVQLLNMTHGKRVQNSLQRLEKQQDEFFEL
ncbi:lysM and putative peptidoglycan-binding domain-containing protein 1 isoform X1 [Hermetia illucens]|nr:lysM and putative peptidoglycan-binding domain-containing protein 1 isoform X1 [Hermetia illucens]